jgi:sulfatase maturation enzyme AslB (radical SAM superfamily)
MEPIPYTEYAKFQDVVLRTMDEDARAGRRHAGCRKCWTSEDQGWHSLRKGFNKWYGPDTNGQISPTNPIFHVELRPGNFCNLKCIMCSPGASSSIAVERKQHQAKFQAINIHTDGGDIDAFWETKEFEQFTDQMLSHARGINITGGEPFIIPEVLKMLDKLLPRRDEIYLSFNTNLTRLGPRLIAQLKQFKNLTIHISLEGVGDINDYVRYPSRWADIDRNVKLLQAEVSQAELAVNHTFQHTSAYAIPELAKYCQEHNMLLQLTAVQGEEFLTLDSVPKEDLAKFREWAGKTSFLTPSNQTAIINSINNAVFNEELSKKFTEYVNVLDSIRGTSYNSTFK